MINNKRKYSLIVVFLFCLASANAINFRSWDEAIKLAENFVSQLTLNEKISLGGGIGWQVGLCVGNSPGIPRLNFTGYCLEDSPTGVRFTDHASAFPAGLNAAMTWDRQMIYERAVAMGEEYRGKGVNVALGPMMNMGRVAAGGRNWEGFGADPYLTGESAAQTVLGIQSQGVIACAKHYIGNEQEHYRTTESSNIDDRTSHELYGYPFLKSVQAGVGSIMCSYNQVNNSYACTNPRSLTEILKNQFEFEGFVMSDWWASSTNAPSVAAGLDMMMPGNSDWASDLQSAISSGEINVSRIDDLAVRIMAPYYLLGQDQDFPETNLNSVDPSKSKMVNVMGNHSQIIRKVGAASNVLLKNANNILPLTGDMPSNIYSIGLFGSDAGLPVNGPNGCPDHGCDDGTLAQGWGSGTTNFPYLISPLAAIQDRAAQNDQTVTFFLDDWDTATATQIASTCGVAIVFVNADSGEDYITVDGNQGDRNNISVWHNGDNLISAIAAVNPNTIVVIHSVGPVLMPWIDQVAAVIFAGLPGQESGNALADVLYGDLNPSGRLVFTVAQEASDYPAQVLYSSSEPHPQINYTEGLFIDYRHFDAKDIKPTFEFGFGLSYTTFSYANLQIKSVNQSVLYQVSAKISNTGSVDGHEVPQLYIGFPQNLGEPPKVLRGFERVFIQAGTAESVVFNLGPLELSIWNVETQQWEVPSGQYQVFVGASSRDIRLTGSFTI